MIQALPQLTCRGSTRPCRICPQCERVTIFAAPSQPSKQSYAKSTPPSNGHLIRRLKNTPNPTCKNYHPYLKLQATLTINHGLRQTLRFLKGLFSTTNQAYQQPNGICRSSRSRRPGNRGRPMRTSLISPSRTWVGVLTFRLWTWMRFSRRTSPRILLFPKSNRKPQSCILASGSENVHYDRDFDVLVQYFERWRSKSMKISNIQVT